MDVIENVKKIYKEKEKKYKIYNTSVNKYIKNLLDYCNASKYKKVNKIHVGDTFFKRIKPCTESLYHYKL